MQTPKLAQGPVKERADVVDILRGFALLGICMANAGYFSLYIFQPQIKTAAFPTAQVDHWLRVFHFAFIDGKFYSLFSLLFGIGFSIIFFQNGHASPGKLLLFYRRLLFLAVFGLAHSFLIWDGDILLFYALVGLLLPLFRNVSNKTLIGLSITLILLPILIDLLKVLSEGKWDVSRPVLQLALEKDAALGITDSNVGTWLIDHSSYRDLLRWNDNGFVWSWQLRIESNRILKVLGMFLLGLFIGKNEIYKHIHTHRRTLRKLRNGMFLIGLPAGFALAYFETDHKNLPRWEGLWQTISYALNVAPLSIAYAITLSLWYNRRKARVLRVLQPVGQMALTNYIVQSVMGIAIYFGIGAGLGGRVGPTIFIPIAICIFLLQVLYSNLWMKHFYFGPLEWLWRQLTYGRRLPLRRRPETAESI